MDAKGYAVKVRHPLADINLNNGHAHSIGYISFINLTRCFMVGFGLPIKTKT